MFKKLVSNLPYNPSLIEHFPDFKASLKRERFLRMVGLAILCMAVLGQLFITIFPAKPGLASSPNDLIKGGFSSQAQAVSDCQSQATYRSALNYFAVSCNNLSSAATTTIHATDFDKSLISLNRLAYGQSNESPIIIGGSVYYFRSLWAGSSLDSVGLKVLSGQSTRHEQFFVLYSSANLVFVGQPATASSCQVDAGSICPKLFITGRSGSINSVNNTTLGPGNTIIYTLSATNPSHSTINNFAVGTNFSSILTYAKLLNTYGGKLSGAYITWPSSSLKPNQTVTQSVAFKILGPISKTPLSASDSNYYNMKMVAVYGNNVSVKLPWTFSKYFELQINNSTPSAGPATSLIISALLIVFLSYFLARNALISRELKHVKNDYMNSGGS